MEIKKNRWLRLPLLVVAALGPWFLRRLILRWLCGARFGRGAYVGHSFVDTDKLELGIHAAIGSLNCFRNVRAIRMGEFAVIGNLNWCTGESPGQLSDGLAHRGQVLPRGQLTLGAGAVLTSRHYIDLHADINIGRMSLIAGVRSTALTHSVDIKGGCQKSLPILIGEFVFVGTNCILLPGTVVADHCVVGAGALVRGKLERKYALYGGVPARLIGEIPAEAKFFTRCDSVIHWGSEQGPV